MNSIFEKSWDDIWIALTLGILQRHQFLEHGTNCHMYIRNLCTTDSIFKAKMEKLKSNSNDISLIKDMVSNIQSGISQLKMSDQDVADCLYITAGVMA